MGTKKTPAQAAMTPMMANMCAVIVKEIALGRLGESLNDLAIRASANLLLVYSDEDREVLVSKALERGVVTPYELLAGAFDSVSPANKAKLALEFAEVYKTVGNKELIAWILEAYMRCVK